MLRTRHRVLIDIEVSAHELSTEQILHHATERSRGIPGFEEIIPPVSVPDEEWLAPQRALQVELLKTPGAIDPWGRSQILWSLREGGLDDIVRNVSGDDLITPVIERLPSPAKERFLAGWHDRERLDPLLEEFYFSFECKVLTAALRPVHSVDPEPKVGDVHRRRYRATLDVRTSILDLSVERIRSRRAESELYRIPIEPSEAWRYPGLDEAELPMARQLQEELIRQPEVLDAYLKGEVLGEVNGDELRQLGEPARDEDIMVHIRRLAPEHQAWFDEARARDEFYDSLDAFYGSFDDEILEIQIFEVPGSRSPGP